MTIALTSPEAAATPAFSRRSRRICIDAHTEFVATLVTEMQNSVGRLQTAAPGTAEFEREMKDIARLVDLLAAVDGPAGGRRLSPLNLASLINDAAHDLAVALEWSGDGGEDLFLADAIATRTAIELLLLALAGDGSSGPVAARTVDGYSVVLEGTMDLTDLRRCWQLRSGRRVVEGEGFRVSLSAKEQRYLVKLQIVR
jgi:hypothetical protein